MSEVFRNRRFAPVEPSLRPRRHREAARVVITDRSSVLLLADTDPGLPGVRWWVTPGGGLDPGETPRQAAVRELEEETGLVTPSDALLGPVAVRQVIHGYSDQILSQDESFFVLIVPAPFEVHPAGLTEGELLTLAGSAWHRLDTLAELADPVWPAGLIDLIALADEPANWPRQLGVIDESTLPVD